MRDSPASDRSKRLLEDAARLRAELANLTEGESLELLRQQPERRVSVLLSLTGRRLRPDFESVPDRRSPEPTIVARSAIVLLLFLLFVPQLVPKLEPVHFLLFGLTLIVASLVLAFSRNCDRLQSCLLSVVMAMGAALVSVPLPGYLEVELSNLVRAGGALGVFALVLYWLLKHGLPQPAPPT